MHLSRTAATRAAMTIVVCVLAGCSSTDEYEDLRNFMREVEAKPKGQIAPLQEFEHYQAFTYGTANRRSPFEAPVEIPKKTAEQERNVGVTPPPNHEPQYLEQFNIASLTMVGTLSQEGVNYALIQDGDGLVTHVQRGDFMGTNWGQIETISESTIEITEIVSDGAGGWLRRPRSIKLTGEP